MNILIVANFCGDFSLSDNNRFTYLARLFAKDHSVELVTSSFYHVSKKQREMAVGDDMPFKLTLIDEPGYERNLSLKRFYSHLLWGKRVGEYIKRRKKPDVIYCAVPSLTAAYRAALFCEKNSIKFVIDIQDLWPEAFRMVFNVPIIDTILFAPFNYLANGIYKRADSICAVSDTYCNRALVINRKCKETITVFLGTELAVFDRYAKEKPMLQKEKSDEIWIAYCGTLGASYDIRIVIDALCILNYENVRFIVMGDGPRKAEFEKYANDKAVNAVFVGRLQYSHMCSLLKACDITVNPIAHRAAQSIINKHADYAAAGLPVLNTQENEEYRSLVKNYEMGYNCSNYNSAELAEKMRRLILDKDLRLRMGKNSRRCAEEKFDRAKSYRRILEII